MDKGVNIGGEDNSVSPLIKFFIDGKQVGKSSVVKKEWFAKITLTVTIEFSVKVILATKLRNKINLETWLLSWKLH